MRQVITVKDYTISPEDPSDFISCPPGEMLELFVVSHFHYYRVGMDRVRLNLPAGAKADQPNGWLPEGDNSEGSKLSMAEPFVLDEATFKTEIHTTNTSIGDNFILYFITVGKSVKDYRWPDWPASPGLQRSFQVHLHIGNSIEDYVKSIE